METTRLDELQAWGVDLAPIHLNASWSPIQRLEVMEGVIQVGLRVRQQTLDPQRHEAVLRLHFASPLPLLVALAPLRIITIGRLAGILQGVPAVSYTLDLCYAQDEETIAGLVRALALFTRQPPFAPDDLRQDRSLVIDTSLVVVRLFPTIPGIGPYSPALAATTQLDVGGIPLRVLTLSALLTSLTAAPDADDAFFVPLVEATDLLQRVA